MVWRIFSANILPVLKLELSLTLNLSKKVKPLYPSAVRKSPLLKTYTNINEPKIFDLLQKNTFMGPPNSMGRLYLIRIIVQ
jgi:hypothetical protein